MLKRNRLVLLGTLAGLLTAPALADGRDRIPVVGPTPLQPQPAVTCPDGAVFRDGACRVTQTVIRRPAPQIVRRVVQAAPSPAASYDFSGFTGGVGANIATGPVGGGGGVIVIDGANRYSGWRQTYSGSSFSYNYSSTHVRYGGGGGCNPCAGF